MMKSAIAGTNHCGGEPPRSIIAAKILPTILKSHLFSADRLCTTTDPSNSSTKGFDCFGVSCLKRRNSSPLGPPVSTAGSPQNWMQNGFDKSSIEHQNSIAEETKSPDVHFVHAQCHPSTAKQNMNEHGWLIWEERYHLALLMEDFCTSMSNPVTDNKKYIMWQCLGRNQ